MKRIDKGRVSLVEFLSSIKFARHTPKSLKPQHGNRFARFVPRVPVATQFGAEESYLVRSAN